MWAAIGAGRVVKEWNIHALYAGPTIKQCMFDVELKPASASVCAVQILIGSGREIVL